MADRLLWVSLGGIVVSGVVGPSATAWASRIAARKQFVRDRGAKRRDELLGVLDEAAAGLSLAVTRLREARERHEAGLPADPAFDAWAESVFVIGQRLALRLGATDAVTVAYEAVRERVVEVAKLGQDTAVTDEAYKNAVLRFEADRKAFLQASKDALYAPISDEDA